MTLTSSGRETRTHVSTSSYPGVLAYWKNRALCPHLGDHLGEILPFPTDGIDNGGGYNDDDSPEVFRFGGAWGVLVIHQTFCELLMKFHVFELYC